MIVEPNAPPPSQAVSRRTMVVIVAVVGLAVVAGLVVGSTLLNTRGTSAAASARYVPADAVMYFAADLALPGAQRDNLRSILERFPNVDPDDVLGEALADTLDDALASGNAPFDYSTDIAPWFDGDVGFALLDYSVGTDPMSPRLPAMAGLFGVRDPAAATAFADTLRGEFEAQEGQSFTSSEHGGVTVWTLDLTSMGVPAFALDGLGFAYAVTDDQLVLANGRAHVEAALDAAAGDGDRLVDRDEVAQLLDALPDDQVGVAVTNTAALLAEMRTQMEAVEPEMAEAFGAFLDDMPPFSVATFRFDDDALLMDSASGLGSGAFAMANGDRGLAELAPTDALFFADATNLGASLEAGVTAGVSILGVGPMAGEQLGVLEQIENALGADLHEFVSWIGSGAMVAGWDGQEPYFGLLLEATDVDAASRRLNQLRALAELGAQDGMADVQVSTESVDGVEVTTFRFGESDPTVGGGLVLEWAIDDGVAVLGFGERFVRETLARDEANSLAASDRFGTAVDRFGGEDNASVFFLDLTGLRSAVESSMPADAGYAEARPYLVPFDYVAGVTRVEGDVAVARVGVVLR